MITVHKIPVVLNDTFTWELPEGAQFLSLQVQRGDAQMWFRVDTRNALRRQSFAVVGTGNEIPESMAHAPFLGTFQLSGGALVFHVFGGIYGA